MTHSQWDTSKPVPSENFSAIYTYIRKIYQLFLERFGLDHNMDNVQDTTLATADGYHKQLTMTAYAGVSSDTGAAITEPEPVDGGQQFFVKKINGLHELCAIDKDEKKWQITENGRHSRGIEWTHKVASGGFVMGYCYFNNLYIVVGYDRSVYTSSDLITWTQRRTDSSGYLWAITSNENILVTVGDNGRIATSTDGITWTNRSSGVEVSIYDVKYLNGIFFASLPDSFGYLTSTDGITWTIRTYPETQSLIHFDFFKGLYVACSYYIGGSYPNYNIYNYICTSSDGINWTRRFAYELLNSANQCSFIDIASSPDIVVVYIINEKYLAISYDGINWNRVAMKGNYDCYGQSISFVDGLFYTTLSRIMVSKDGINWLYSGTENQASTYKVRLLKDYLFCSSSSSPDNLLISKFKELS